MSKTARDIMTPWRSSPGDELGNSEAGVGYAGSTAGPAHVHAIGADDWIDHALVTMTELKVRRLPVVDRGRLVGVVSQGDLASSIEEAGTWLCS
jgi:CBS domain-containing protein